MSVLAARYGISVKQGLIDSLWKIVSRGQAHDSAGGCNSDKTNRDIYMRGINGLLGSPVLYGLPAQKIKYFTQ